MRQLFVVTHPEATHHVDGLVGGWHDSALTPHGHECASRIAEAVAASIPSGDSVEIFSSDLQRTRQTAEPIARRLDARLVLDAGLREKSYGEAEGRPQSWLDERFVPPPATGDRLNHFEGILGSETRGELADRVYPALERILASRAQHQVIVTHGFAAVILLAAWLKVPPSGAGHLSFKLSSGGISVLQEDDFYHNRTLATLNDVGHLRSGA